MCNKNLTYNNAFIPRHFIFKSNEIQFQVITNHTELELAMFMSKTLVSSIVSFTKKSKAETEERTRKSVDVQDVQVVRVYGREEYNNARPSRITGLDRELPSPEIADSTRRSSLQFKFPQPARHIRKEDSYDHLSLSGLPRETRLNPESDEGEREVGSRYREMTRSREDLRETISRRTSSPESYSRYPEIMRTREESRETLSRRAASPERSREVSDLRIKLNPVHADPYFRPIDQADSRSSSNPHHGTKRVGTDLRYEPVKQPRYENYPQF